MKWQSVITTTRRSTAAVAKAVVAVRVIVAACVTEIYVEVSHLPKMFP